MTPEEQTFFRHLAVTLYHTLIRPVASSVLYGISIALFVLVAHLFRKKRIRGRPARIMASVAVACFLLTTANFISLAMTITSQFQTVLGYVTSPHGGVLSQSNLWIPVRAYDLYFFTQYIIVAISDTIVVWRTQALYPDRPTLYRIPGICLLASISCLIAAFFVEHRQAGWPIVRNDSLSQTVDEIGQALSLFTNVITTFLVGIRLWSYRKWFVKHNAGNSGSRLTEIQRKILLLFETGALFCIVQLLAVAYTINVDFRTNQELPCDSACIFTNYALSRFRYVFAANYSIIVLVLVHNKSSFADVGWVGSPGEDEMTESRRKSQDDMELDPIPQT